MNESRVATNRLLLDTLDESILEYIDSFVHDFDTDLEKAIAIYIKLAQLLWYNPRFLIEHNYEHLDKLSSISMEHNEVICLHWAVMYSKLLNMYEVDNELIGNDEHLRVKVKTDAFLLLVDATKHGVEYRDYMLSDLTNTKLNFKIANLTTHSSAMNKKLNLIIDKVYKKLNIQYYDASKIDNLIHKFRYYAYKRMERRKQAGEDKINKKEIDRRISFINLFYHMQKSLHEVEKLQVFSKYYKSIFEGFDYDTCRCLTMCEDNERISTLLKLIVVVDDKKNTYYYLETDYGFAEFEKEELMKIFMERNIYFRYDRFGILGFDNNEVKKLIR